MPKMWGGGFTRQNLKYFLHVRKTNFLGEFFLHLPVFDTIYRIYQFTAYVMSTGEARSHYRIFSMGFLHFLSLHPDPFCAAS
jgi:hypothetical protein